jgi:succinate-acetate transporter protein
VFLLCWLTWTVLLWVATFRVSLVLNLLFLNLIAVLALLAAGLGFGNTTLVHVGGYLGIVLSVIGFHGPRKPSSTRPSAARCSPTGAVAPVPWMRAC